jgi:aminoglycoside phosphotransferase (APT) family kinase protein
MSKNESPEVRVRAARNMARQIITHHFGNKPKRVAHLTSGLSNFVFMVTHGEGDFVVRISPDAGRLNAFIKEQWAMVKAREVGVPTPEILEVGNEVVPSPYMVSRRVIGNEATFHPKRREIIREMGKYAALINSVPTSGFGSTFDWSSNQLSRNETWKEYLDKELNLDGRLRALEKRRMLKPAQIKKLRSILKNAGRSSSRPALTHGDIRLKNVIVDEEGQISAVIDWEDSTSNLSPHWELSIALHDLSIDEKQEFLVGYGLREKKVVEMMPVVKALNLLNYAPEIERLAEAKDASRLEQYRTRLGGILDFYSL